MKDRLQTIQNISDSLKKFKNVRVFLFGSSARGDFRSDSDIDLLILLPDDLSISERIETELEINGILVPIELESGFDISPVILQDKVWEQRKTPFTITVNNERVAI